MLKQVLELELLLMRFIRSISIEFKMGFLVFFAHLDPGLVRAYQLILMRITLRRCRRRSTSLCLMNKPRNSSLYPDENTAATESSGGSGSSTIEDNNEANRICAPMAGRKMRTYRLLTNCTHAVNIVKFSLILIISDGYLLPIETNCYLFGRLSAHQDLSYYLPFLALSLAILNTCWRYVVLSPHFNFEMDPMVFLMQTRDVIETEVGRIVSVNDRVQSMRAANIFPENIMQRVLFYELDAGTHRSTYELRPNRTETARRRLHEFLDWLIAIVALACAVAILGLLPYVFDSSLFDGGFVRNYPGCCPSIERMLDSPAGLAGGGRRLTLDSCVTRQAALVFDLLDNLTIYVDSAMCLVMPMIIATIITHDLEIYWQCIDGKAKDLVHRLKLRESIYPVEKSLPSGGFKFRGSKMFLETDQLMSQLTISSPNKQRPPNVDTCDYCVYELQSLLCDFFDCSGRANRFVHILLTFSVGMFMVVILLFGYFAWKVDGFWDLTVIQILFALVNLIVLFSASVMLRLKRIIDRTYVNLCSSMAYDRSNMKLRWIIILECYTYKAQNSFTLLSNIRFTWMFVLNLMATSLSFLLAIATLKEPGLAQPPAAVTTTTTTTTTTTVSPF